MFALRASTAYLIICANQKGVAAKNARGRSSARGAENEVWIPDPCIVNAQASIKLMLYLQGFGKQDKIYPDEITLSLSPNILFHFETANNAEIDYMLSNYDLYILYSYIYN